jgi:hypothetical protein
MATIRRFEDIEAWQKARELVQEIYKACAVHVAFSGEISLSGIKSVELRFPL